MSQSHPDMSLPVDMTSVRATGPVRLAHPVYVDLLPPCNQACPAGEDIQAWLALAQAGKYREAWEVLVRDNPMPAIHGRVCYHPCETACNRRELDEPSASTPSSVSSATRPPPTTGLIPPPRHRPASGFWSSAPAPPASPPPTTSPATVMPWKSMKRRRPQAA